MNATTYGRELLDRVTDTPHDLRPRRLADKQASHLDYQDDCDRDQQDTDRKAADTVPATVAGDLGGDEADERDRQAQERGAIFEEDYGKIGILRLSNELPPRLVRGPDRVRFRDTGTEREAFEHHGSEQHA